MEQSLEHTGSEAVCKNALGFLFSRLGSTSYFGSTCRTHFAERTHCDFAALGALVSTTHERMILELKKMLKAAKVKKQQRDGVAAS